MLDKRCLSLLNIINGLCENSGYKVIETSTLIYSMPQVFGMDADNLKECLKELTQKEYISVKYEDESEICVCPLSKGRFLFEEQIDDEIQTFKQKKTYFRKSFWGAFFGALFGMIILGAAAVLARVVGWL